MMKNSNSHDNYFRNSFSIHSTPGSNGSNNNGSHIMPAPPKPIVHSSEALLDNIIQNNVNMAIQTQQLFSLYKQMMEQSNKLNPQIDTNEGNNRTESYTDENTTISPTPLFPTKIISDTPEEESQIHFVAHAATTSKEDGPYNETQPLPNHFFYTPEWRFVNQIIEEFKTDFYNLSYELQEDTEQEIREEHQQTCFALLDKLNERLHEAEMKLAHSEHANWVWGFVFKEMFPYFMRSRFTERVYYKPKKYAGDFLMIEMIYKNKPSGDGKIGKLVDQWCLETSGAKAVRSRRVLLKQLLTKLCNARSTQNDSIRILNLGSGCSRELFDFLHQCDYTDRIEATCVDIDSDAFEFANQNVNVFSHNASIRFLRDNIARWAAGKGKYEFGQNDIIYSSGLTDYFGDKMFKKLVTRCYDYLKPGGVVIIGNFSPTNPHRAFMDYIVRWKLIHRSEDDLKKLFADTPFGQNIKVISEPHSINLFAVAQKPIQEPK
jgi:extracellular factor (EF) 3-hydroxypalmitic acid methyl ester biosynthesis protein